MGRTRIGSLLITLFLANIIGKINHYLVSSSLCCWHLQTHWPCHSLKTLARLHCTSPLCHLLLLFLVPYAGMNSLMPCVLGSSASSSPGTVSSSCLHHPSHELSLNLAIIRNCATDIPFQPSCLRSTMSPFPVLPAPCSGALMATLLQPCRIFSLVAPNPGSLKKCQCRGPCPDQLNLERILGLRGITFRRLLR